MTENFKNKLLTGVLLAPFTTFNIGGPALYYIEPMCLSDYKNSLEWALLNNIPFITLGGGSNILVHDSGYKGLVINTKKLNKLEVKGDVIISECGVTVDGLVEESLKHALTGIEFAAGLPGSVGGALFMNARAYASAFSDIVEEVHALKRKHRTIRETLLKKSELGFAYKKSIFQKRTFYVYKVLFKLSKGHVKTIQSTIEEIRNDRKRKGQYAFPNAGCIFKNDHRIGIPTGKIIEELGLKGKRIGNAEIYREHANFIINRGKARAEDVYKLIKFIENEVKQKKGIKLKREINLVGDWDT